MASEAFYSNAPRIPPGRAGKYKLQNEISYYTHATCLNQNTHPKKKDTVGCMFPEVFARCLQCLCRVFAGVFSISGPSWRILGPLGPILGASWGILGPSWEPLGASWGHLGSILGPSWSILEHLGASWAHLGSILGPLGAILGAILSHLEPSWEPTCSMIPSMYENL